MEKGLISVGSLSEPSVTMVGGCGRIGLPFSLHAAGQGYEVTIVDTDSAQLSRVLQGEVPFREEGMPELLDRGLANGRLKGSTQIGPETPMDLVVIFLGTPLVRGEANVDSIIGIVQEIAQFAHSGTEVVLRSTVPPGSSREIWHHYLHSQGIRFFSYWPERVLQGKVLSEISSLPQIIGHDSSLGPKTRALLDSTDARIIECSLEEAESAKLIANSYRFTMFNLANEFKDLCSTVGVDYERVRNLVTQDYPRATGLPKSGPVGGPCLAKDTAQLATVREANSGSLLMQAIEMNKSYAYRIVAKLLDEYDLPSMTVGLLGLAFKPDSDDYRDSQGTRLRDLLHRRARCVMVHDPFLMESQHLHEIIAIADIVIIATSHREYRDLDIRQPLIRL